MKHSFDAITIQFLLISGVIDLYAIYFKDGQRSEQSIFKHSVNSSNFQTVKFALNGNNLIGFVNRGGTFISGTTSNYALIFASNISTNGAIYPFEMLGSVSIGSSSSYLYLNNKHKSNNLKLNVQHRSPDWQSQTGRAFLLLQDKGAININQLFSAITSPVGSSTLTITVGPDAATPQAYSLFVKTFSISPSTNYAIRLSSVISDSYIDGNKINICLGDLANFVSSRWQINFDFDVGSATPTTSWSTFNKFDFSFVN